MKYLNNIKIENNKDMPYGMLTQLTQYGLLVFSYIFMIGLFINLLFFISFDFYFNFLPSYVTKSIIVLTLPLVWLIVLVANTNLANLVATMNKVVKLGNSIKLVE